MSKTKEITFTCSAARVEPNRYGQVTMVAEDPNVEEVMNAMDSGDVVEWANGHYIPSDIFTEEELSKWAEANGFTSEEQNTIDTINEMCIESLSPDLFEKWEEIKNSLESNRSALKENPAN